MKKITYILSLLIVITLIGCGNTESSDTSEAETTFLEESLITDTAAEEPQAESDSEETGDNDNESLEADEGSEESYTDSDIADSETESDSGNENSLPEYTVTAFEESRTMYASDPVNVRKGPSTDFEIVGFLGFGQDVTVTGQADTKWYEIQYGEDTAFVSNKYLQDEMPVNETAAKSDAGAAETASAQDSEAAASQEEQPKQGDTPQPVTEVKNVAGVILVGDSRFVQMQNSVGANSCTWIAESGKGYNWFSEKAITRIDSCVGKGSKILINLGVNDTSNLQKYISLVNAKADEWVSKGATVYYSSVNPVWENPYVNEEQVEYFNSQMKGSLNGNVHWIDSHSYLTSIGYKLVDGLHYSEETYQNLYAYYMSCL
ncbi:MAG: SH3 domain-containing protein [Lachnospiraceae bacterium]|nr:SH3 domain-containing protein [Lachnospiraceae bacterium]